MTNTSLIVLGSNFVTGLLSVKLATDLARCVRSLTSKAGSHHAVGGEPSPKEQTWFQCPHTCSRAGERGLQGALSHQADSLQGHKYFAVCMPRRIRLPNPFASAALFFRPIQACSVWSSILIRTCPSTRKRLWTCTRARRGTRCPLTSTPSPTPPTGV